MQDSIEDYIQISQNCKEGPTQIREEVFISPQIKKECDAKAMQIVHFAIEGKMRSDVLFRCLPYINQSHYQDIVEERAISKLCGYPLCSKALPDMPRKQFFISTKNNKIYDITDRKNFCSNICYRASIHIKEQIDATPLWLRKHNEKTHYTLINKSEKGLPGEVVDQGNIKQAITPVFTSICAFTEMSLNEAEELELKTEKEIKKQMKKPKKLPKNLMKTINENEEEDQVDLDSASNEDKLYMDLGRKKSRISRMIESGNEEKDRMVAKDVPVVEKKMSHSTFIHKSNIETQLYKCFKEWFTLETFIYLYGEAKVKEKLNGQKLVNYFETLKIAELEIEHKKRYMEICRKLHLREIADESFDQYISGSCWLNPIPDYQQLKEENRQLDLKVKSFYCGELCIEEDKKIPTVKKGKELIEKDEYPFAVLPLVNVNNPIFLRRKIFLNSLNKTIRDLFQTLQTSPNIIQSDLQGLVRTFKLEADNIVFKPKVWKYIAIMLLKILSIKDENLKNTLESLGCRNFIDQWLSFLPHRDQLLDDTWKFLHDIDRFIKNYVFCK